MNILLLGSRGWIGSNIQKQRPNWTWTEIHTGICDLEDEKSTELLQGDFDVVIHSAGFFGGLPFNRKHKEDILTKNNKMNTNICKMVTRLKPKKFIVISSACLYPPQGYRSFGPIRGLLYGGQDYGKHANDEIVKLAMIETREALDNLDQIMTTPGLDGIYIGPADLSLAIGETPSFDKPEDSKVFKEILNILEHAKKNNIYAGIHNMSAEYAQKMIDRGFNLVTVGSDQRFMSAGAKNSVEKIKNIKKKEESKGY